MCFCDFQLSTIYQNHYFHQLTYILVSIFVSAHLTVRKEYNMCFKSCIIKEVFSKNWPISNGYQKVAIILTSEFSYTGWRLSHMWEMISNCTMKVHRMPTEDFRVTQHISPATPMLRRVKVHTFGPSELLHAPTTYGRNACRGAKNFNKIMQFWSSFKKKGSMAK